MSRVVAIIAAMAIGIFAQPAIAGPFGLSMGMSIKDIDPKAKLAAPGVYTTTNIPKSHSAFKNYAIKVGREYSTGYKPVASGYG